jgi:hypothetical protein
MRPEEEEEERGIAWISMNFATCTSDSRRAIENPSRYSPLHSIVQQV